MEVSRFYNNDFTDGSRELELNFEIWYKVVEWAKKLELSTDGLSLKNPNLMNIKSEDYLWDEKQHRYLCFFWR